MLKPVRQLLKFSLALTAFGKLTRQAERRGLIYYYKKLPGRVALAGNLLRAKWYLRGCRLGKFVQVLGNPRVANYGELVLGDKVIIDARTARAELVSNQGARLEIGERTYINYGTSISAHQLVKIGERCRIGTYCNIADNDFHGIEDRMALPPSSPVILEDNVWLGAKVIVLKGVTIGHDSVIGAGSVVTRSIPPHSIAVGQPARVIRTF